MVKLVGGGSVINGLSSLVIFNIAYKTNFSGQSNQDPKSIKCYNEKTGYKYQNCWKDDGFETCFSKYDSSECVSY